MLVDESRVGDTTWENIQVRLLLCREMSFTQIYAPTEKKKTFFEEERRALGLLMERFRSLLNSLSGKVKERLEIKKSQNSLLKEYCSRNIQI